MNSSHELHMLKTSADNGNVNPHVHRQLHMGLLGYSDIARRRFIPALQKTNLARLSAIASRESSKWDSQITEGVYKTLSYQALITAPDLDMIYISLPNHLHEEWTIKALEAGKHVICEKPLAMTTSAVKRMIHCADRHGLLLFENLMFLQHPQHTRIKALVDSGRMGNIKSLRCVFGFPIPASGNFRLDPDTGGGAFHDLIRYPIGTALYHLKGELTQFQGIAQDRAGLNVAMHGQSLTTAGELFSYAIAFGQQYESYYELVGDQGKIRIERAYTTPDNLENHIFVTFGAEDASFQVPPSDHFQLMIEHACRLVISGADFRISHDFSRKLAERSEAAAKGCIHIESYG